MTDEQFANLSSVDKRTFGDAYLKIKELEAKLECYRKHLSDDYKQYIERAYEKDIHN